MVKSFRFLPKILIARPKKYLGGKMMKNLAIIVLSVFMLLILSLTAFASTIGVGVEPGLSIEAYKQLSPTSNEIDFYVNYGINEQSLIYIGYGTDVQYIYIGGRYAFNQNMALTLLYTSSSTYTELRPGFRLKYDISEELGLVGELDYLSGTDTSGGSPESSSSLQLIGQAEYSIGDMLVLNGGIKYISSSGSSSTSILIGSEYYPTENLTICLDYEMATQTGVDSTLGLDVSFAF
jgi:hypothetical protein